MIGETISTSEEAWRGNKGALETTTIGAGAEEEGRDTIGVVTRMVATSEQAIEVATRRVASRKETTGVARAEVGTSTEMDIPKEKAIQEEAREATLLAVTAGTSEKELRTGKQSILTLSMIPTTHFMTSQKKIASIQMQHSSTTKEAGPTISESLTAKEEAEEKEVATEEAGEAGSIPRETRRLSGPFQRISSLTMKPVEGSEADAAVSSTRWLS